MSKMFNVSSRDIVANIIGSIVFLLIAWLAYLLWPNASQAVLDYLQASVKIPRWVVLAGGIFLVCVLLRFLTIQFYQKPYVRTKEEVEELTHLPVLGTLPRVPDMDAGIYGYVTFLSRDTPRSYIEEVRRMRHNLLSQLPNQRGCITVTSLQHAEGKTATCVNLGGALARVGKEVILADFNLRRPRLHAYLGMANSCGVTSILSGEVHLPQGVQRYDKLPNLHMLPSGPVTYDTPDLISSSEAFRCLQQLTENFEIVLIDTPSVLNFADAEVIAKHTHGLILVVDHRVTTKRSLMGALSTFKRAEVKILGIVLNGFTGKMSNTYWDEPTFNIEDDEIY